MNNFDRGKGLYKLIKLIKKNANPRHSRNTKLVISVSEDAITTYNVHCRVSMIGKYGKRVESNYSLYDVKGTKAKYTVLAEYLSVDISQFKQFYGVRLSWGKIINLLKTYGVTSQRLGTTIIFNS